MVVIYHHHHLVLHTLYYVSRTGSKEESPQ